MEILQQYWGSEILNVLIKFIQEASRRLQSSNWVPSSSRVRSRGAGPRSWPHPAHTQGCSRVSICIAGWGQSLLPPSSMESLQQPEDIKGHAFPYHAAHLTGRPQRCCGFGPGPQRQSEHHKRACHFCSLHLLEKVFLCTFLSHSGFLLEITDSRSDPDVRGVTSKLIDDCFWP